MNCLYSIGIGFLTALIGGVGTGVLSTLCVDWYRIPDRDGGSGYLVLFLGLLGGLLGLSSVCWALGLFPPVLRPDF